MGDRNTASAEYFIKNLPNVSVDRIRYFLNNLPPRYFDTFPLQDQLIHLDFLNGLTESDPYRVSAEENTDGTVSLAIISFDFPSEFSIVTGLLGILGMNIQSGDAFTLGMFPDEGAGKGSRKTGRDLMLRRWGASSFKSVEPGGRRKIIDRFTGTLSLDISGELFKEKFTEKFDRFSSLTADSSPQAVEQVKEIISDEVAVSLSKQQIQTGKALYPVEINFFPEQDTEETTSVEIISEDTPFFLYALSSALALKGISIEHVRITTRNGIATDLFEIADSSGKPILHDADLRELKLSILFTKQFTYFLPNAPDPYAALRRFETLSRELIGMENIAQLEENVSRPTFFKDLAKLLGASDFLWEDFIRTQYENIIPLLRKDTGNFSRYLTAGKTEEEIIKLTQEAQNIDEKKRVLNEYKDREIYLIDLDHIIGGKDFFTLSTGLTNLAEGIIRAALRIAGDETAARYGYPRTAAGLEAAYAVTALGKLGGRGLGYASDLELLFIYSDNGTTDGPEQVSNAIFFEQFFRQTVHMIEAKREGIFQIDLRLRPHGNAGPIAVSLDRFISYYSVTGDSRSYERLALTMLRCIAGDPKLGQRIESIRDRILYSTGSIDLEELRDLRRIQFQEKTKEGANAKFSPGGLVDLEYTLQILMIRYGMENPSLRTTDMHKALLKFGQTGIIDPEEAGQLQKAYGFLRSLINSLRMLRGNARDLFLPERNSSEYIHLARRMGYQGADSLSPAEQLQLDFQRRTAEIRRFIEQYLGRESIPGPPQGNAADLVLNDKLPDDLKDSILCQAGFQDTAKAYRNIRALSGVKEQREQFAQTALLAWDMMIELPDADMALNNWEFFVASIENKTEHFRKLSMQPKRLEILLNIFAGSQFLSDTLIRKNIFFDYVTDPETVSKVKSPEELIRNFLSDLGIAGSKQIWLQRIREFRQRETLRIGTRDICLWSPMKEVVSDISNLADAVLRLCLLRLKEEGMTTEGFCLLAFGKLGGRELNYSSDLDLLALYDPDRTDEPVCRKIVERVRGDLSSHTAGGYVYRVDLRLRPHGRSGRITVPLEAALKYYRDAASPWEIQALLKLRPAAGDLPLGNNFLREVKQIVRTRIDYHGYLDEIRRLRIITLEQLSLKNIPSGPDVKNGRGGLRDIEFAVQALQLKGISEGDDMLSGNTLEGLDACAAGNLVTPGQAKVLRWNYIFLRRIEHYLQLLEDRQVHAVPIDDSSTVTLAKRLLTNPDYADSALTADNFRDFLRDRMEENWAFFESVLN
ncbi:MAG: glutamate-ammonia-ligase adenylyltransferase [Spirochaetia bacterium]